MLRFYLTVFVLMTDAYQTTSERHAHSRSEAMENQSYNDDYSDGMVMTENHPGQVSDHLIFDNMSTPNTKSEEKTRKVLENLTQAGRSFSALNETSEIKQFGVPDTFAMYDESYYGEDGWMRGDHKERARFMLSKPQESPYAVLLAANATVEPLRTLMPIMCSGTLLTERWVLTAASCFKSFKIVSDIFIYAGGRSLSELNRKHFALSQTRRSSRYFFHPDYTEFDGNKVANDIALVKAKKKFKLSDSVNVVSLSFAPWSHKGFVSCSVTGFGKVQKFVDDSRDFMRKTYELSVKKPCRCFEKEKRSSSWLCTKSSGVCEGDSGSGLVCDEELVAVTSRLLTMADFRHCNLGAALDPRTAECGSVYVVSVFHETYPHLDWINSYTKVHSDRNKTESKTNRAATTHMVMKLYIQVSAYYIYYTSLKYYFKNQLR